MDGTAVNTNIFTKPDRDAVITIRNLYKSFGDNKVLNGLDLDLYRGENMVVLGKSGSGKSGSSIITGSSGSGITIGPSPSISIIETGSPSKSGSAK